MSDVMVIEGLDGHGGTRCRASTSGRFTHCDAGASMSDYNEIVPPEMGALDEGMLRQLWPDTGEVMAFGQAGIGVIGGVMAARWIEGQLTSRGLPKFATPLVHGIIGIASAKWVSKWNEPIGVGVAGAFGAYAVARLLEVVTGRSVFAFSGFEAIETDGLADLLNGDDLADVLPAEMAGIEVGIEERALPAGMGAGMGSVSVESAQMAGWHW